MNNLFGEEILETKICNKCNETKHISEFNSRTRDKNGEPKELRNDCKSCQKKQGNLVKNLKKYYPKPNPATHKCECCKKGREEFVNTQWADNPFVLDHDHITGEYRGWICQYCNTALSRVFDDVNTLRNMIDYLERTTVVREDALFSSDRRGDK